MYCVLYYIMTNVSSFLQIEYECRLFEICIGKGSWNVGVLRELQNHGVDFNMFNGVSINGVSMNGCSYLSPPYYVAQILHEEVEVFNAAI